MNQKILTTLLNIKIEKMNLQQNDVVIVQDHSHLCDNEALNHFIDLVHRKYGIDIILFLNPEEDVKIDKATEEQMAERGWIRTTPKFTTPAEEQQDPSLSSTSHVKE